MSGLGECTTEKLSFSASVSVFRHLPGVVYSEHETFEKNMMNP